MAIHRKKRKFKKKTDGFETITEREERINRNERREYVEAGMYEKTNKHHRHTKKLGGSNDKSNISVVPVREHQAFNVLFRDGHMPPPAIAEKFSRVWLRPDWEVVARKKGEQCVTPCGKESLCKHQEQSPNVHAASELKSGESMSSVQSTSDTPLTAERLMSFLELVLGAINAQSSKGG